MCLMPPSVCCFVAFLTESSTIIYSETELWIISKWFYVIRLEITTLFISTPYTSIFVSLKYSSAP